MFLYQASIQLLDFAIYGCPHQQMLADKTVKVKSTTCKCRRFGSWHLDNKSCTPDSVTVKFSTVFGKLHNCLFHKLAYLTNVLANSRSLHYICQSMDD